MFICEKCPELVVRRIENKLGIHGVATCELQYNDVPAQLCGQRRRGLTKYVMSLMNGARVAISGQALGIAEAAFFEARKYAEERKQFKKSIDKFPAIYDMLTRMKTKILATRALLYETTRAVDLRNGYTHITEHGENVTPEIRQKAKYWARVAAVLTPMCKAQATEVANQVAYDAIQIHGGTGFMKDFTVERFYRDARITNIYEGTTQLQVVAAIGGVIQRNNDDRINELMALPFEGTLLRLKDKVVAMYEKQLKAIQYITDKKDSEYQSLMAHSLVKMETMVFVGLLMLRDALKDSDREMLAERYILDSESQFEECFIHVTSGDLTTIDKHREIIDY
jgi:phosphoribosylanthranilate isomerase